MIVRENLSINGREYIKTYSDDNNYVVRDCVSYEEAIDPVEYEREYAEGEPITEEAGPEDYESALAEMGVDFSD